MGGLEDVGRCEHLRGTFACEQCKDWLRRVRAQRDEAAAYLGVLERAVVAAMAKIRAASKAVQAATHPLRKGGYGLVVDILQPSLDLNAALQTLPERTKALLRVVEEARAVDAQGLTMPTRFGGRLREALAALDGSTT